MFKVYIESLDGKVITERTGKTRVLAKCARLPNEGDYILFFYLEELESPGVAVATDNVRFVGIEQIQFSDSAGRPFKVTVLENLAEEPKIKNPLALH